MSIKYILTALAAVELATAQFSDACSSTSTKTINSAADAQALSSCTTFTGNIALSTDLAGAVSLDGIQTISGNLVGRNASGVQSISASQLRRISGDFILAGMTQLSDVEFPQLTNIDGELNWQSIPNLGGLTFGMGVQRIAQVTILDTQIQDLSGINLKSAQSVTIGQNIRLNKLSWQLAQVEGLLNLDGNGGGSGFDATFGNLESAGSIAVNSVSSLSLNSLKNVTKAFNILDAPLKTFSAPNLTLVGDLQIRGNQNLNNLSLPVFKTNNGGLNIQSNPALTGNITLPELTTIRGAINCTGAFDELLFPKLNRVGGAVNVVSTGSLAKTCPQITQLKNSNVIQAKNTKCSGKQNNGSGSSSGSSGSGTSSSDSGSTSSSAAAPGLINSYPVSLFGSTGLLAVMLGMI